MPLAHVTEASERILELLGGGESQRAEAYATLTQVAQGMLPPCTLPQPDTTVRVLGVEEGADATAVSALLGQFGEVIACTLCAPQRRRGSGQQQPVDASALVTFVKGEDAQKAIAAQHLTVRSEGTGQPMGTTAPPRTASAAMSATGDAASRHQAKVARATAVLILLPCAVPLMEKLNPPTDSASISVEEFRRGSLVLASMVAADMIMIGGQICEGCRCLVVYSQPSSHFARVFHKEAQDLTASDALTVACGYSALSLTHCNLTDCMRQGGTNELEFLNFYSKTVYCTPEYKANFDHVVRIASLLVDLIADPGDVNPHAAIGGCLVLLHLHLNVCPDGRSPAKVAFEKDFVQTLVEAVRDYPAPQRILKQNVGGARMWCIKDVVSAAPPEDAIRAVIDSGLIDIVLENLSAIRMLGDVSQVCVMQYWYGCFYLLSSLDLRLPAAAPIVEKLWASAADIQWCIEHSVAHMEMLGWSVCAQGTLLAAAAFGRDEGAAFVFGPNNMIEIVRQMRDTLRPAVPVWPLKDTQGLELLDLVISDRNKSLLLSTSDFIEVRASRSASATDLPLICVPYTCHPLVD